MTELSEGTKSRIRKLFQPAYVAEVEEYLRAECGDTLPFSVPGDVAGNERIHLAVLKLSGGDLTKLRQTVREAQIDWRDVLMAAGFGEDPKAHLSWNP